MDVPGGLFQPRRTNVFTLLIPCVELARSRPVHITTVGVTALHPFSILPLTGQLDTYHPVRLDGTASVVEF